MCDEEGATYLDTYESACMYPSYVLLDRKVTKRFDFYRLNKSAADFFAVHRLPVT